MLIKLLEGTDDLISIFSNHGGLDRIFQLSFTFAIATTLLRPLLNITPPNKAAKQRFLILKNAMLGLQKSEEQRDLPHNNFVVVRCRGDSTECRKEYSWHENREKCLQNENEK